jgi:hypothetical protein
MSLLPEELHFHAQAQSWSGAAQIALVCARGRAANWKLWRDSPILCFGRSKIQLGILFTRIWSKCVGTLFPGFQKSELKMCCFFYVKN